MTNPAPPPAPKAKMPLIVKLMLIGLSAMLAVFIISAAIQSSGPDWTQDEQLFLEWQDSSLDDADAVRIGRAACDLISTGGSELAVQWLAGADAFSRAGYVQPNPEPISMYDARQIVDAADSYLCDAP